jgi:hypothetical protein
MNIKTIGSVLLVSLGLLVLAYSAMSFRTGGKPVDFLGMRFETTGSNYVPLVAGAVVLICGIALYMVKAKPAAPHDPKKVTLRN